MQSLNAFQYSTLLQNMAVILPEDVEPSFLHPMVAWPVYFDSHFFVVGMVIWIRIPFDHSLPNSRVASSETIILF